MCSEAFHRHSSQIFYLLNGTNPALSPFAGISEFWSQSHTTACLQGFIEVIYTQNISGSSLLC
uniref:Uncharacterized protein n=1 Tax=Thermosporothrix sp. COM3 TaxID=2490863 RepID=A0A455SUB9_9CHLR|nr:hypothetical protein KTC_55020 [Thermosporothrix sp. COM3]